MKLEKSARIGLASLGAILFFVGATANTAPQQPLPTANQSSLGRPSGSTTAPVRITSPTTGTIVHAGAIVVVGTTTQPLGTGHEIWIVVQPQGTGRYYPQWPPASVAASGDWTAPTVVLGGSDTFLVDVIDADPSVIAAFKGYLQQNQNSFPGMSGLPAGAQIADSVTIARQ